MDRNKLLFGRGAVADRNIDLALAVLRVVAGVSLAYFHGLGKVPPSEGLIGMVGGIGFPAAVLFAWLAATAEFAGGILIAIGLLTRPAAAFVVVHFILVILMAHAGDPIADRELPALFLTIALFFAVTGAGRYSVDAMLGGRTEG